MREGAPVAIAWLPHRSERLAAGLSFSPVRMERGAVAIARVAHRGEQLPLVIEWIHDRREQPAVGSG